LFACGTLGGIGAAALIVPLGCGAGEIAATPPPLPPAPPPPAPELIPVASADDAGADARDAEDAGPTACPAGMALVDTTYCPNPVLRCLKSEYNKPNHITICHRFAPGQRCAGKLRRQRYCIDRYEYPNREGDHPPVMVSWYDGAAACAAEGKRLCWQSEWESACEGPDKLPFPYGLSRDPAQCNIDNMYVKPDLERMYSSRPDVAGPELLKLDQSVASGERPGCTSGFGVHDLTGNLDEWVNSEEDKGKSKWAGLKGGAWGHVRNACRPMTTSHPPEFTYYFISFRCCADAAPDAEAAKDPTLWKPPPMPAHAPPGGKVSAGWTTKERGPNRPK
jgi:Ni/Co efflux regulator RcnB